MPQEFVRQLLSAKNPSRAGGPDDRLKMIGRVPFPDLPRGALMELMNQVVEICGCDFSALPPVELRPKFKESMAELSIVSDGRPFSNETFHGFRRIFHRSSAEGCLTPGFSCGGS